jgi:glycosyltransferase involved in cell wall biosynthesis
MIMRILQVISTFYPALAFGGPVRVVYEISKELANRGHEIEVYTTKAYDQTRNFKPKYDEQTMNGFKITYFDNLIRPGNLFLSPEMIVALQKRLKEFDVVHIHFGRQVHDIAVNYYAKKYGVPYVLQAHGSLPRIMAWRRLKWVYDVLFGYRLLRDASKVIALSRVEAEQYKRMGVPEEKIAVIPNGIDLSEYADLPPKGSFKRKFNIDEDEKIVLYLGRIHRIKGVDILVKAFANIVKKLDDVKLVIVGPDDGYLGKLEALIKALKIEGNVLITGPLYGRDKLEVYVDADVYVLPSKYEIWGMTVLEAVACGTLVILTENCGIAEYFRDKVGLAVKPDPSALSGALLEMLLNKQQMSTFRQNCRTIVEAFSISRTVSKLERAYEDAAHD